ncbi:hypothetical protein AU193_22360 [Mycobacterium sp. GA-1285]|nr:hypothetical protein AU193_22360 [Mycobacterium sp. GA-1285]
MAVSLGVLTGAQPAWADMTQEDYKFLTTLESIGWTIHDPAVLISQGHMVCNEGLAHGVSWLEMRSTLMGYGYSRDDASLLIHNAVLAYCPTYSHVSDEIYEDLMGGGR